MVTSLFTSYQPGMQTSSTLKDWAVPCRYNYMQSWLDKLNILCCPVCQWLFGFSDSRLGSCMYCITVSVLGHPIIEVDHFLMDHLLVFQTTETWCFEKRKMHLSCSDTPET